jgi:hypothetical protein
MINGMYTYVIIYTRLLLLDHVVVNYTSALVFINMSESLELAVILHSKIWYKQFSEPASCALQL